MSKDGTLSVVISGKKEAVLQAKKLLLQKLQQQAKVELHIPRDHHRVIIGREGKTLKALQEETSTNIQIPKSGENVDLIVITGTTENCRNAAAQIQHISDNEAKRDRVVLPILKAYHPLIVGYKDEVLNRVRQETGATIHVPPSARDADEIVVSGEKVAVAMAVAQLQAIYYQLKSVCGELTANVKKSQHRYIIGRQGANLREIMEKTGVVVEVPPFDSPSDTITLRGAQPSLVPALTLVYEKANSCITETVPVPSWLHKYIIGRKGSNLKKLTEGLPKVHVQFSDEGDAVEIEGPPEEVLVVKANIEAQAADLQSRMAFEDVQVDPIYHPRLIGKAGATIFKLKEDTGASINMPAAETKSDIIHIEGTPEACKAAKQQILDIVKKLMNFRSVDIIVPQRLHSLIIGAGGSVIRDIMKQFNEVAIEVPHSAKKSDIIVVRGDKKDVDAAEKFLIKKFKQLEEENYQELVSVFKQFHRHIIGRGGSTIKQIKTETNTRISVPSEDDESDFIVVVGKKKDVETARAKILVIQNEMANILSIEIAIDPRFHQVLKAKIASSISQDCGGVVIRFPTGKDAKSDKVSLRGPSEDVEKAKALLLEIANEQALNSITVDLKVNKEMHRFIIGRNGTNLKALQAKTRVRVIFPPRRSAAPATDADAADTTPAVDPNTITLFGSKEGCATAKDAILKRVAEIENTIEEDIAIPADMHHHFLVRQGQFLKDISEEFGGVAVSLPKENAPEAQKNTIHLKGGKEDIPKAIARIHEFIADIKAQVTLTYVIPHEHHRAIMGVGGKNLKEVTAKYNVQIKFPAFRPLAKKQAGAKKGPAAAVVAPANGHADAEGDSAEGAPEAGEGSEEANGAVESSGETHEAVEGSSPSSEEGAEASGLVPAAASAAAPRPADVIAITGREDHCALAAAALRELIPQVEVIQINPDYHRFIIGSKGEAIRQIMTKHEVFIKFSAASKTDANVSIKGLRANIDAAKTALEARVQELDADAAERALRSFAVEVTVDPKFHSALIGKGGAEINKFRTEFDVQIEFPRAKKGGDGSPEHPSRVVISGYEKNATAAAAVMRKKVAEMESITTLEVEIHPKIHARVIGAKGANVRKIQEELGVRINFPRDKDSSIVTIVGPEDACNDAKDQLENLQEEFIQDVLEREYEESYLKPSRESQKEAKPAHSQFAVRNAPWEVQEGAFPTLGGAASTKPAVGVWGLRK